MLLWFYYGLVQSACDAGRDNSKRVYAGTDTGAVLDFPRRRKQWISVCVLWLLPPGYYHRLSVSTDSYDSIDPGLCTEQLSGGGTPDAALAQNEGNDTVCCLLWKYAFFAGRLFFPDTPADHVCKLYAVFIAGIDFPEKTQICTDEHQPDTDLSAQLLLCYSLSGSDRLVCSGNAP